MKKMRFYAIGQFINLAVKNPSKASFGINCSNIIACSLKDAKFAANEHFKSKANKYMKFLGVSFVTRTDGSCINYTYKNNDVIIKNPDRPKHVNFECR